MTRLIAIFIPESTATGMVYHPANRDAVKLAGVAGCRAIPEDRFPYIRALGIETVEANGTPIGRARVDLKA